MGIKITLNTSAEPDRSVLEKYVMPAREPVEFNYTDNKAVVQISRGKKVAGSFGYYLEQALTLAEVLNAEGGSIRGTGFSREANLVPEIVPYLREKTESRVYSIDSFLIEIPPFKIPSSSPGYEMDKQQIYMGKILQMVCTLPVIGFTAKSRRTFSHHGMVCRTTYTFQKDGVSISFAEPASNLSVRIKSDGLTDQLMKVIPPLDTDFRSAYSITLGFSRS